MAYISVTGTANNRVTKRQFFETLAEAQAHAATHGGFSAEMPSEGDVDDWRVDGQTLVYDPIDPIIEWRETAQLPKFDFLTAARRAQLITNADYKQAALGGWPDVFAPAFTGMTEDEQVEAEGLWAMTTTVHRNAPLIAAIIAAGLATEAQVDALFGWETPA